MLMDKNIATAVEYVEINLSNLLNIDQLTKDKLDELKFEAQGESVKLTNVKSAEIAANVLWAFKGLVDEIVINIQGKDYLLLEESEKDALRSSHLIQTYCVRPYDLAPMKIADQSGFEIKVREFVSSNNNLGQALKALDNYRFKYEIVRIITEQNLVLETAATVVRVFYMTKRIQIISNEGII